MTDHDQHARVLDAIRAIPEGFVRTYGDVSPGAPRLAGRLLATEHAPDVPWWRVVRADGSLAAGDAQRARLEAEGVPFRPGARARVDLKDARVAVGADRAGVPSRR
jgi:methylated-DNA-protein-cysteine methyltransferase related protein